MAARDRWLSYMLTSTTFVALILRSPFAHARITAIDASGARNHPGVACVWTGADVLPRCGGLLAQMDLPGFNEISDARMNDAKTQSQYQPYKDAAWGFINHWYPALFSEELPEQAVEGIQIAGVPILLRRAAGKLYAIKDQCVHRGVRLSAKPMCFNDTSIACWYHGFNFDLATGVLNNIVANPDSKLIGKTGVTTYPVQEVAGRPRSG